eukprot:5800279-Prorocentrum_lima.AAC.1
MEALGKHCYSPGDSAVSSGGRLEMADEGLRIGEPEEQVDAGDIPHTVRSRVRSVYPRDIKLQTFESIEQ